MANDGYSKNSIAMIVGKHSIRSIFFINLLDATFASIILT
jgi:hypothetical protein